MTPAELTTLRALVAEWAPSPVQIGANAAFSATFSYADGERDVFVPDGVVATLANAVPALLDHIEALGAVLASLVERLPSCAVCHAPATRHGSDAPNDDRCDAHDYPGSGPGDELDWAAPLRVAMSAPERAKDNP